MPFLYYDLILHAAGLGALAVCWATILVGDGMLLAPVQAAWRGWYRQRYASELDEAWWWKPVWGCYICTSGQLGLWGYIYLTWGYYHFLPHLYFVSLTLLFAALWRGLFAWSQKQ